MFAACLDFDKFEGAAASSVASTTANGSSVTSSSSAGGSGGSGTVPTCEAQYGDAPSYAFCVENALVCEFRTNISMMSCGEICADRGGECLQVYDPQPNCDHGGQSDCTMVSNATMICVCSRGCGGDPPCVSPDVCTNSTCN
jgi:hypothetical protein